jgi:phosphate:Na+ symporter
MQVDVFTQVIVPVIGGVGIFMLGLEFMANGIQALAVAKMRNLLAKIAGHRPRVCLPVPSSLASSSPPPQWPSWL